MPASVPWAFCNARLSRTGRPSALAAAVLLSLLAAGCGSDKTQDSGTIAWAQPGATVPTGSPPSAGPPLNWQSALSGDTLTVELRDPSNFYRIERVELVGPNGMTVAASEIERDTYRGDTGYGGGGYGPSVGVGGWGGSRGGGGVGIGLGFPLGGGSSVNRPPEPVGSVTRARLRIPDPELFRRTAENWIIRVTSIDRNNQENVAVIPAPKPPA